MRNQKILITGGAGFIGYNLYKKLYKNNKIFILDYKKKIKKKKFFNNCNFIYGDISNSKIFYNIIKRKIKFDYIYHLAAETSTAISEAKPIKCFKTNILGTINLYYYCIKFTPKFLIFSSSMAVYGKNSRKPSEAKKCLPISNYGISKLSGEKILMNLKKKTNLKIFRIFNAYGIYQDYNNNFQGMLSIYLAQILKYKKVEITGSLGRTRDFIYITDILSAITNNRILKCKKNLIYNLGSGKETSVKELVNLIFELTKIKKRIIIKESHSGDTFKSFANINLLIKKKWKNKIKLNIGIKKVIKDIKKFNENCGYINW